MLSFSTPESSNDIIILIISFISSFETNKLNPLLALTAPFTLIFLSIYSLHLKLNCLLIQICFILLREWQYLLVLSFLCYLTKNQKIHPIELVWIFEFYLFFYLLTCCQETHFLYTFICLSCC